MACRPDDDELKLELNDEEFLRYRNIQDSWTPKQERERNTSLKYYYSYRPRGVQRGLPVEVQEVHNPLTAERSPWASDVQFNAGQDDDICDNEWWGQEPV